MTNQSALEICEKKWNENKINNPYDLTDEFIRLTGCNQAWAEESMRELIKRNPKPSESFHKDKYFGRYAPKSEGVFHE